MQRLNPGPCECGHPGRRCKQHPKEWSARQGEWTVSTDPSLPLRWAWILRLKYVVFVSKKKSISVHFWQGQRLCFQKQWNRAGSASLLHKMGAGNRCSSDFIIQTLSAFHDRFSLPWTLSSSLRTKCLLQLFQQIAFQIILRFLAQIKDVLNDSFYERICVCIA